MRIAKAVETTRVAATTASSGSHGYQAAKSRKRTNHPGRAVRSSDTAAGVAAGRSRSSSRTQPELPERAIFGRDPQPRHQEHLEQPERLASIYIDKIHSNLHSALFSSSVGPTSVTLYSCPATRDALGLFFLSSSSRFATAAARCSVASWSSNPPSFFFFFCADQSDPSDQAPSPSTSGFSYLHTTVDSSPSDIVSIIMTCLAGHPYSELPSTDQQLPSTYWQQPQQAQAIYINGRKPALSPLVPSAIIHNLWLRATKYWFRRRAALAAPGDDTNNTAAGTTADEGAAAAEEGQGRIEASAGHTGVVPRTVSGRLFLASGPKADSLPFDAHENFDGVHSHVDDKLSGPKRMFGSSRPRWT
ncbi:uncharacterized protein PG998_013018 [Apiospora kogelbergensis]|uniref:uncharacterized protein n=1 Tax=Apiospora kogelbergensis TaxID=1337665 RepID=UPI00312FBD4E